MKNLRFPLFLTAFMILSIFGLQALAEAPQLLNYQGRLTDSGGSPLDTTVSIVFTIYDASSGGNSKWTETQGSVTSADGIFNVLLGSVNPILDTVFNDDTRYLGIKVGGDPEISTRTRIVSVGYALQANRADTADYAASSGGVGGWTDNGSTVELTTDSDVIVAGPTTPTTPSLKFDLRGHGGASSPFLRFYFNSSAPSDLLYSALEIYSPAYNYTPFKVLGSGAIIQSTSNKSGKAETAVNKIDPDPGSSSYFTAGNVGIGTTSPTNLMHIIGSDTQPVLNIEQNGSGRGVRFSSTTACAFWIENSGNHGIRITNANGDGIHVENAGGYAGYFNGGAYFRDNVGIGVAGPTEKLEVAGVVHSTTGGFRFPDGSMQTTASTGGSVDAIPPGVILMWFGAIADIPEGWALCDGSGGTPDLTDRFVLGASHGEEPGAQGGTLSHDHTINSPTFNTATSGLTTSVTSGGGTTVADGNHDHQINIPGFNSSTDPSLPPFYKLAYIMKQ